MADVDIWLRGGVIVDGTGGPPFRGDMAILGDTITAVTAPAVVTRPAKQIIDCAGRVIAPGFIDIHTHSDVSFLLDPAANSKLMQGVTTEVVGNCGFSPYPVSPHRRELLADFLRGLGMPLIDISWTDFDGYADAVEACEPVMNVAPLVGHGALRIAAAGTGDIPITTDLLADMQRLLHDCLEQGAFGVSTGLTYVPSRFATPEEIHALARALREHDALYATHARATDDHFGTFDEAIEVGRCTDARVQYSHVALNDPRMWGRAHDVIGRFQQAVDAGIDVRYDVYPYAASASSLTQYLPGWVQERGEGGMRELLTDRHLCQLARDELAQGLFGKIPWNWERVMVSLAGPGDEELEGRTIADASESYALSPEELCLYLCARHGNGVQVVLFYRLDDDVTEFLVHPLSIVGSDGSARSVTVPGKPHPRSFGAHARLLQRYVVERKQLSIAEAVHKSSQAAASRLGILDRGSIAPGMRADIAVLDLEAVRETATWTSPCRLATGIRDVWINGERVVAEGVPTGRRPGQVLRHGA